MEMKLILEALFSKQTKLCSAPCSCFGKATALFTVHFASYLQAFCSLHFWTQAKLRLSPIEFCCTEEYYFRIAKLCNFPPVFNCNVRIGYFFSYASLMTVRVQDRTMQLLKNSILNKSCVYTDLEFYWKSAFGFM